MSDQIFGIYINGNNIDRKGDLYALPDNCVDLAIVDPPFGIGQTWRKSKRDTFYDKAKQSTYHNQNIPPRRYFKELMRVSKNQIVWGGNYFTRYLPPSGSWIIWDKLRPETAFRHGLELAWTSMRKPTKKVSLIWDGAKKCESTEKIHPHQKPVQLYKWCLLNYAKPGQTILFTHAGSASGPVACVQLGFSYIAYEIDKGYFGSSLDRIKYHTDRPELPFDTSGYLTTQGILFKV